MIGTGSLDRWTSHGNWSTIPSKGQVVTKPASLLAVQGLPQRWKQAYQIFAE
jgi:hypothetical protein